MSSGFSAIFWGIVTFSLLIVIHEGGHFFSARMFGVKVHEFMIGLPGPAMRFRGKKTTYGITAIPLGGYVRIAGMEPGPEDPLLARALQIATQRGTLTAFVLSTDLNISEEDADRLLVTLADWDAVEQVPGPGDPAFRARFSFADADDPRLLDRARAVTYRSLSLWKRIVVLSSGVVLNLLTAILVFTVVIAIYGVYDQSLTVSSVAKGSGAEKAGIMKGDTIVQVDGKNVDEWFELTNALANRPAGDTVSVAFVRDGERQTVQATLGRNAQTRRGLLGVTPGMEFVQPNLWEALLRSLGYIGLVFTVIAGLFNPSTFQATASQSSSVIGASYMAADAARAGALSYAGLVAGLSLSLGAINVFPIPPLDGGKIALEIIESLRGRPLSRRLSLGISATGAILLFALIGYLVYADVVRFIIG